MYKIPRTPENEKLYSELTVYPVQHVKYGPKPKPVICYRKSDKSIYIPRYFGCLRFGVPSRFSIPSKFNNKLEFNGEIREYQREIVSKTMEAFRDPYVRGGTLALSTGSGKCLGKDTPVIMYDGSIKMVQDISIGEKIMGDDSTPRTVLSVSNGVEEMFEIRNEDGDFYRVNKSHILSVVLGAVVIDLSLENYLQDPKSEYRGYRVPLDFDYSEVKDDPYIIGSSLSESIPMEYKCNIRYIRLKTLAGIIDCYCKITLLNDSHHGFYFPFELFPRSTTDDVKFLVRSLGFCYRNGFIYGGNLEQIPCKFKIIKNSHSNTDSHLRYAITVIPCGISRYYGFEIDGNRRFVLGDFSVTHNTVIALKVISELKVKTLIVIHKEILMDQWKERIKQFIPSARVGIIQQSNTDTVDKDIILGMIQSISMKDYDPSVFDGIDLLIIDECHVINSRSFSQTLFKVRSLYKLGLSATPNRADGLDKVITYHIGPIIFTLNTTILDPIIHLYKSPEIDICVETNYMGNINLPKLITDLSNSEERNDFIVKQLVTYSLQNRKIIVFSDRVNHCKKLKHLFDSSSVGERTKTSGLFIGKMDSHSREESMNSDIIFCSYSMAKEGFDLKELDTLMFATPRSDVVQAVGRILRQKNNNIPIVIDIIDSPGVLMGQFMKRKKYYNEKKYLVDKCYTDKFSVHKSEEIKHVKTPDLFSIFRIKKDDS